MKNILVLLFVIFIALYSINCKRQENNHAEDQVYKTTNNPNRQISNYEIKSPENLSENHEEKIEDTKELPPNSLKEPYLPDWARDIGLSLPEGLEFVPEFSNISEFDKKLKTVNSINLVFTGSLEQSLKEAEKIAKKANIPPAEDFMRIREQQKQHQKKLLEQGRKVEFPELKGMIYSNSKPDPSILKSLKYIITIIVEENGRLVINAVDNQQSRQFSK